MSALPKNIDQQRLLSHESTDEKIEATIEKVKARVQRLTPTVERQLMIVDQLANFPFGQFLLQNNGGWNGYWTDYVMEYPNKHKITGTDSQGRPLTSLEKRFFEFPKIIATQQRYIHFQNVMQEYVREGAIFASVPCGLMRDVLKLNFKGLGDFRLVGIDLDGDSLEKAKQLAVEYGLSERVEFHQEDAWNLPFHDRFTLLNCNGLNMYEPDDDLIIELYRQFFKVLIPGGVLVTSTFTPDYEWNMSNIDLEALEESAVFDSVLKSDITFTSRSTSITKLQLQNAGFEEIQVIWDDARMFPTVVARKPK